MIDVADHIAEMTAGRDVRSFAPAWEGFAIPPAGRLQYADVGPLAAVWAHDRPMLGESNAVTFALTNLPVEIRPAACRLSSCYLINDGALCIGAAQVGPGGVLTFHFSRPGRPPEPVSALVPDPAAFTPIGRKGLASRWAIAFPK